MQSPGSSRRQQQTLSAISASSPSASVSTSGNVILLLDFDHTLRRMNLEKEEINYALIFALMENGIFDLYFFTDMVLFRDCIVREEFCKQLRNLGMRVHGVLSALDSGWAFDKEKYSELEKVVQCAKNVVTAVDEHPELVSVSTEVFKQAIIGKAFANIVENENYEQLKSDFDKSNFTTPLCVLQEKLNVAKFINDVISLSDERNYEDAKGVFFELFMRSKPDWARACLVADDKPSVLRTVTALASKEPDFPFMTIEVEKEHFDDQMSAKIFYSDALQKWEATNQYYEKEMLPYMEAVQHFVTCIQILPKVYQELTKVRKKTFLNRFEEKARKTHSSIDHSEQIRELVAKIEMVFNDINTPDNKLNTIIQILLDMHETLQVEMFEKTHSTFLSKKKVYKSNIEVTKAINSNQDKHHLIRIIGLLLKTMRNYSMHIAAAEKMPTFLDVADYEIPTNEKKAKLYNQVLGKNNIKQESSLQSKCN